MTAPTIEISNVVKDYGIHKALKGVSFEVPAGQCLALLGHNGAGKTTLMKLMLGLTRPTEGSVRVLGAEPGGDASLVARSQIGFLPENVRFHEAMTGEEVLSFYARLKGEATDQNAALLGRVGLADAAKRRVKTYSKGMRQRLGLAQALLGAPKLLLLDEPTSGLDPLARTKFYNIIYELAEAGTTILLSSHALTELEARTDKVAIMARGQLQALGALPDLRRDAGLPVRINLDLASDANVDSIRDKMRTKASVGHAHDGTLQLTCAEDDKMAVVGLVADLGDKIKDMDLLPPSLDEVYAFYGAKQDGTQGEEERS